MFTTTEGLKIPFTAYVYSTRISTQEQTLNLQKDALEKIGFKSITENIDTTTSGGKLVFHIFGALAEFERDIISERTNAGPSAARGRGRLGGRPKAKMLDTPKKVALAQSLYENRNNTIDEICKTLNVSRAMLYRYIQTKAK